MRANELKDLLGRLERMDERNVNMEGRLADLLSKYAFANTYLMTIEGQLRTLSGRMAGIEDQIRAIREAKS